ncbi:MAG: hypothetical protein QXL10_02535 [Candidatus Bathyarchaeia archaeon]
MKLCPRCGYRDNPLWRHSRFDFDADYMRFDDAESVSELREVTEFLRDKGNFVPFTRDGYVFYRRGTGGLWLYRVAAENYRVPRERKKHKAGDMKHG